MMNKEIRAKQDKPAATPKARRLVHEKEQKAKKAGAPANEDEKRKFGAPP